MSSIDFSYADPNGTVVDSPDNAEFEISLLTREVVNYTIRTTKSFRLTLIDGVGEVDLSITGPLQCWRIRELYPVPEPRTWYKQVTGDAHFTELVNVDPTTFEETEASVPAWEAAVASVTTIAAAALASQQAAAVSAADAENSIEDANTAADNSEASATDSASSASEAFASKNDAATSAASAAGSASDSATSATNSANSASDAEDARDLLLELPRLFVQDTQPTLTTPYIWIKTNIGGDASKYALAFEDGIY